MDNKYDYLFDEPDEIFGIPLEEFNSPHLLAQLDEQEISVLQTLVICKIYDQIEERIDTAASVTDVILSDYCGTNRQSRPSAPK